MIHEKDPVLAKSMFDNHDKKMLYLIRHGKPLVITAQDQNKYHFGSREQTVEKMVKWFIKMIVHSLVYSNHPEPSVKMVAFAEEVERLCHIAAVVETSGIGHVEVEQMLQTDGTQ